MTNLANDTAFKQDLDDVEAHFDPWFVQQPQVIKAGAGKPASALTIDSSSRALPFLRRARFYFDKHQAIAIAEHQVNLTAVGTKIRSQKFHSVPLQVLFSGAFAELAEL